MALYESCLGFRSSWEVTAVSPVIIFGPCCVEGFTVACGVELKFERQQRCFIGADTDGIVGLCPIWHLGNVSAPSFSPSSPFQSWSNIFEPFFLFYSLAISLSFLRPWTRKMGFGLGFQYLSIDPRTRKIFLFLFLLLISSFAFHDAFQTLA